MRKFIMAILACCWLSVGTAEESPKAGKAAECPSSPEKKPKKGKKEDPAKRAKAVKLVCERLGIGKGAVIADVGCGKGTDTLTFANVVGTTGKVYGQEIKQSLLDSVAKKAREKKLDNIATVLGVTEDPRLPDSALDLIYMRFVFHHFAKPADMLGHFFDDLKPGGRVVIVDREKGPQRKWPDMAGREKKHAWSSETTVVRLAREAGFLFETALDDLWPDKKAFVLVLRKPETGERRAGDPDLPSSLDGKKVAATLPCIKENHPQLLFLGIDRGRVVLPALREACGSGLRVHDVVLEEWRTREDELPPDVKSGSSEIVRTENGDLPGLTNRVLHAAIFADGYSRLWEPEPLLKRLHRLLCAGGHVAILDRKGPEDESRRVSGHHRRIAPGLVKSDMEQAGFKFVKELNAPTSDRFFLLFRAP